jgi:hypothetical protein
MARWTATWDWRVTVDRNHLRDCPEEELRRIVRDVDAVLTEDDWYGDDWVHAYGNGPLPDWASRFRVEHA